jgi:hypothetical protein
LPGQQIHFAANITKGQIAKPNRKIPILIFSLLLMTNEDENNPTPDLKQSTGTFQWRDLFLNKAFDLIIVIAGITIAFELDGFKQNNDERSLERFYLENMMEDLELDIQEYNENMTELETDRKKVFDFIGRIEKNEDISDSLGLVVYNLMSTKTFEGHRNAFSTIMNGNGLSLIRDEEIRNLMLEHYRLYAAIERSESKHETIVSKIHDYFGMYIDYNHVQNIKDRSLLQNIQTKNLFTLSAIHLQASLWRYDESHQKAKALHESIKLYLAR